MRLELGHGRGIIVLLGGGAGHQGSDNQRQRDTAQEMDIHGSDFA